MERFLESYAVACSSRISKKEEHTLLPLQLYLPVTHTLVTRALVRDDSEAIGASSLRPDPFKKGRCEGVVSC